MPFGKVLMIDSFHIISFGLVTEMAKMLTQVSAFFDDISEVVVDIGWKCSNVLELVAKQSSQSYHLLDR